MNNARTIWDRLIAAGLTPAGAAGLMGNLYAESGLRPNNLQNSCEKKLGYSDADYTAAVDCGAYACFVTDGAGYGLAQWTYSSRKAALLAYAKAQGRSIGDLDMQLGYLLQELQSLFPAVWDKLRATDSVREASDCVLLQFERPADQSSTVQARRAGYAQEFYNQFAGGNTMYLMTAAAFADAAKRIATQFLTSYMLGPWGWPANDKMIARACSGSHGADNKTWLSYANAIKGKGFLFDCVGLIKKILWGWSGDLSRTYGGAGYACNGVPDYDALGMINCCKDVSADFSSIVQGEVVYMPGHIGIYVGDGVVSEATPRWKWGVQLSTCLNVAGKQVAGTAGSRTWTKHGKLPWVDYSAAVNEIEEDEEMVTYKNLTDVPSYYRDAVQKAVDKGALNGTGDGINVSEDLCRTLTVLDRLGKLD